MTSKLACYDAAILLAKTMSGLLLTCFFAPTVGCKCLTLMTVTAQINTSMYYYYYIPV